MPDPRAIDFGRVVSTLNQIQNITTIDQLNAQKANLVQAVIDLKTHATDQDAQISELSQKLSAGQLNLVSLQTRSDALAQQVSSQQSLIDKLKGQLSAFESAGPPATPTALADSFRKVVDQIQSQARLQAASGPATTIRSMDIEVKGLVNVQSDGSTVMVLPTLSSQVDPNQLSTLRVSFAAVPGTGVAPPPVVSSVTPNRGPGSGGTQVLIAGSGFTGTGAVLFGGAPAASFSVVSDTQVRAVSPSGAGVIDVVVVTAAGGSSATGTTDQFTYIAAPTITQIDPPRGPANGNTEVVITGTGFTGATSVLFGRSAAKRIAVAGDTKITALSPPGAGTVDVVVTAPGGNSSKSPADQFQYMPPAPTVTGLDPKGGPIVGGTQVTITGTNFIDVSGVTFGKTPAQSVTVNSDTQLIAVSPRGAAGAVDIIVSTPSGNSPAGPADQFTYQPIIVRPPDRTPAPKTAPKRKRKQNPGS